MMKSSKWKHLRSSMHFMRILRIKSNQRGDLAQSSGEKKPQQVQKDGLPVYIQVQTLSFHGRNTMKCLSNLGLFSERLYRCNYGLSENSKCCCLNRGGSVWTSACGRLFEYLRVSRRVFTHQRECEPSTDWFRWHQFVGLSVLIRDWVIICQESLFVFARLCVCVCVSVGLLMCGCL